MKWNTRQPFFRILSLALIFCLAFTGCTPASDPEGLFGTPSSEPEVIREGSWDYDLSEVPYHYGNAFVGGNGSPFCDYGEKVLFAGSSDPFMLYTYDKRTGKIETFCKDAVCNHNQPSCPAFEIHSLVLYQGKIYGHRYMGFVNGNTFDELAELKNGRFETVLSSIQYARFHQGDLYALSHDGTLLKYSEGNLKNPVTIKEDFPKSPRAIVDNYFYFAEGSAMQRFDLNDPDTVETIVEDIEGTFRSDGEYLYYRNKDYHLMRCDLDGSNPIPVTQMPVFSFNYDEEYIYFTGYDPTDRSEEINNQLFRIKRDLSSQPEPEFIADLGFRLGILFPIYQLDALFLWPDFTSIGDFYIINKDGTGLQKLVLPE